MNEKKLPLRDKVIWCMQGFVANLPWVILGYYLLYFYTDVMKISAALAGTIIFAARMFDAITDLLIGWCVDNFHFKWGKFRTWIRFAIPLNIVLWPLTWLALKGVPITVNIVLACIGYGCFGAIGCTAYYIPTNCQLQVLTHDEGERASLVAWKGVTANLASVFAVAIFMPLVNFFGGDNVGFFAAALVLLIPYVGFLWADYIITKKYELTPEGNWNPELESATTDTGKRIPLGKQFKMLFTNRPVVILVVGILLMYLVQAFRNSATVYVFEYYFELPDMATIALTAMTISSIVGALVMNPVIKFLKDPNRAYVIWTALTAFVYILFWVLCKSMDFEVAQKSLQYGLLFWLFILGGFFQGAYYNFAYVLLPMCVEYGKWKNNVNQSGFIYSLNGFTLTAGSALGAALLGFALNGIGYAEGVEITETIKSGLIFWGILAPSLMSVGHAVIQMFFGLDRKKYDQIMIELTDNKNFTN